MLVTVSVVPSTRVPPPPPPLLPDLPPPPQPTASTTAATSTRAASAARRLVELWFIRASPSEKERYRRTALARCYRLVDRCLASASACSSYRWHSTSTGPLGSSRGAIGSHHSISTWWPPARSERTPDQNGSSGSSARMRSSRPSRSSPL